MAVTWVESALDPEGDFPVENLPYGVCAGRRPSIGVAIGDKVLDVRGCESVGLLAGLESDLVNACCAGTLNALMSLGQPHWSALRERLTEILTDPEYEPMAGPLLKPQRDVAMLPPAAIGDYTDFYASVYHATNVGRLFRPDSPLMPNYKHLPVGYHGRASSIVASGADVRRPSGQIKDPHSDAPAFGPTRALDYELEVGMFIGPGNGWGEPISINRAPGHIFGFCLVNDWSARDMQAWEYQPLGPFLAKSFATSISPWVVTVEAVEPFRVPAFARSVDDPKLLPYLFSEDDQKGGGLDLTLEVYLRSREMRAAGAAPMRVSRGNFRDLYWTPAQLVAHHTSNGCNLRPGDLLASGTVSGPAREAYGCLLEITRRGAEPLALPGGEKRTFLEDGDEVILRGYCVREGFPRVGFGECRGTVVSRGAASEGLPWIS